MDMDEVSILKYLQAIRNQRTNNTTVTKQFLEKLTEKQEWTEEQCHIFFESLLRYYIKDEKDLDLMLAVSGLKEDYKSPKLSAAKRREKYLDFLSNNDLEDVSSGALEKREQKLLKQIAFDLKLDIDCGKINKLFSAWVSNTESCYLSADTPLTFLQRFWKWLTTPNPKKEAMAAEEVALRRQASSGGRLDQHPDHSISRGKNGGTIQKPNGTVIIISIIVACLLFATLFFAIGMHYNYKLALIRVNDNDIPSALGTDTDRDTGTESIDDLTSQAQKRIVNIDEPEEYDVEAILKDIGLRILANPAYGDMVARGLCDIELSTGETIGDLNPWMVEMIAKIDEAMSLPPDQHPRGLEQCLEYREGSGNQLFVTHEYFYNAARLCFLLTERLTLVGVREWESCENWLIDSSWNSSDYRAEKNSSQITCPALILQGLTTDGKLEFIIGFSLDDGRLLIYDPEQVAK